MRTTDIYQVIDIIEGNSWFCDSIAAVREIIANQLETTVDDKRVLKELSNRGAFFQIETKTLYSKEDKRVGFSSAGDDTILPND